MSLREDALGTALAAVHAALPYENTLRCLRELELSGRPTVFAVGKAAVPMARAAAEFFGSRLKAGLLITKYGHLEGFSAPGFACVEAAHPVSDENSVRAAEAAMALAASLTAEDTAVFLLSGGGSALMEKSAVPPETQREATKKLLARGAEIGEMNALRKRLSLVKGGRLAALCRPAKVLTLALSDVVSNDKSVIASGPTVADETPDAEIRRLAEKYLPDMPELLPALLNNAYPAESGDGYRFVGDINILCEAAAAEAAKRGYTAEIRDRALCGEAREAAERILLSVPEAPGKHAYIYAGETTVTLRGDGLGGRNQEMALAAALQLRGREHICFVSVGSDGTDGPTDAAGGFAGGGALPRRDARQQRFLPRAEGRRGPDNHRPHRHERKRPYAGPHGRVNACTIEVVSGQWPVASIRRSPFAVRRSPFAVRDKSC